MVEVIKALLGVQGLGQWEGGEFSPLSTSSRPLARAEL